MSLESILNKMGFKVSLRTKVLGFAGAMACLALISITITSFVSIGMMKSALEGKILDKMRVIYGVKSADITDTLARQAAFTVATAQERLIEGITIGYEGRFYGASLAVGEDVSVPPNTFDVWNEKYLERSKIVSKTYNFSNIYIAQSGFQIIFSTDPESPLYGKNLKNGGLKDSKLAACATSASHGKASFADVEYLKPLGRAAAFTCSQIRAEFDYLSDGVKRGDVLGVVIAEVNFANLEEKLDLRGALGKTGQAYLVGSEGKLRSNWGGREKTHTLNEHHSQPDLKLGGNVHSRFDDHTISNEPTRVDGQNSLGANVVAMVGPVKFGDHTWMFVAEEHDAEFNDTISSITRTTWSIVLIILLVIFVSAGVYAAVFTKMFTAPIELITQAAQKLSNGNTNINLSSFQASEDEIGEMVKSFQHMVESQKSYSEVLDAISKRDLSTTVAIDSSDDYLGMTLQRMQKSLHDVVSTIRNISHRVDTSAAQLFSSAKTVSTGASEQANSVQTVSENMAKVMSNTDLNAKSAGIANQVAIQARELAEHGQAQLETTVSAMEQIHSDSQKIAGTIKVIDEIAFQTNLLALNAAVEAARAGKHGKGFAVVADEVRNLASRSARAAEETSVLINSSKERVDKGLQEAQETAVSFKNIVAELLKLVQLVEQISVASNKQSSEISEATRAVHSIDGVTQSNTAAAEETASSAQELSALAKQLHEIIESFKTE